MKPFYFLRSCILSILFILSAFTSKAQAPTFDWAKQFGSTLDDYGRSIATDAAGNVYTTGSFWSTVDFDPGPGVYTITAAGSSDIFVSKVDAAGNFVWAKAMGSNLNEYGYAIAVDNAGNVYTTGHFTDTVDFNPGVASYSISAYGFGDTFISKLDASGNFVWAKRIGGVYVSIGYGLTLDAAGNIYATGYFNGTADFDPGAGTFNMTAAGNRDDFVMKLNSSGNFVWAKQLGGMNNENGTDIAVDATGNVYTTGIFQGTADFDPGVGTYTLAAASTIDYDVYISKLSPTGNFVWAKQIGSTSYDSGNSLALDGSGNVYTTGSFVGTVDFDPGVGTSTISASGSSDIFISKLDVGGNYVWAKKMGGSSGDVSNAIAIDAAGNVYTTGAFNGNADFDPGTGSYIMQSLANSGAYDSFISKLDGSGNFIWAKQLGGNLDDFGTGIVVDASNNIISSGYFAGTGDFDTGTTTFTLTTPTSSPDIYIHKLSQGTILDVRTNTDSKLVGIYPNPTSGLLNIDLKNQLQSETVTIEIYNALGQTVYTEKTLAEAIQIDTRSFKNGIYIVKVSGPNATIALKKIMKE